jgi:hypothetical protein
MIITMKCQGDGVEILLALICGVHMEGVEKEGFARLLRERTIAKEVNRVIVNRLVLYSRRTNCLCCLLLLIYFLIPLPAFGLDSCSRECLE